MGRGLLGSWGYMITAGRDKRERDEILNSEF